MIDTASRCYVGTLVLMASSLFCFGLYVATRRPPYVIAQLVLLALGYVLLFVGIRAEGQR